MVDHKLQIRQYIKKAEENINVFGRSSGSLVHENTLD